MSTNRQGPGIEAGAIAPHSGMRAKRYSHPGKVALAAGTYGVGTVDLPSGAEGLIVDAGIIGIIAVGATGDFDYTFQKVIAAGNGRDPACEGVPIPIQKAAARGALAVAAAFAHHRVSPDATTGTAPTAAATTITLAVADAGVDDDEYEGCLIKITAGKGAGQIRRITTYTQSTRVATVDAAWDTNPDDGTSVYLIEPQLATRPEGMRIGLMHQGAAVAGPTSTTMDLAARLSIPIDDYYVNSVVTKFTSPIERRIITDSADANDRITVNTAWTNDPVAGDVYRIDHDNLIVRPNDSLICEIAAPGATPPAEWEMYVDVQELSAYGNNN